MEPWSFEHIKWLLSLGIGGILAGVMFFVYRKDMTAWRYEKDEQVQLLRQDREVLLESLGSTKVVLARIGGNLEANTKALDANVRAIDDLRQHCGLVIGLKGKTGP